MGRPQFTAPVERPRDRGELEGDYEVVESAGTTTVASGADKEILNESDPVTNGGWFLSNATISVLNWDASASNNAIEPELVQFQIRVDTSSGTPVVDVTVPYLSGKLGFNPLLKVPEGYRLEANVQNDTQNDIEVVARATVLKF
jgi:hypothetical protein